MYGKRGVNVEVAPVTRKLGIPICYICISIARNHQCKCVQVPSSRQSNPEFLRARARIKTHDLSTLGAEIADKRKNCAVYMHGCRFNERAVPARCVGWVGLP